MEYNLLTKQLLEEGYSEKHFPDYVRIPSGQLTGNNPLRNIYGGFEYRSDYVAGMVLKTPCGKHLKGSNVLRDMSYQGITWSLENNNAVFQCPYLIHNCSWNDARLQAGNSDEKQHFFCACQITDEIYDYDNSIEKAKVQRQAEINRKYEQYVLEHNGRVCRNHTRYDEKTEKWKQVYDPETCATYCNCLKNEVCPILGRPLSKKRGNVYYDLKQTRKVRPVNGQMSLFDGESIVCIEKGKRFFSKPCSIDICEAFVKAGGEKRIAWMYGINHSREKLMDETWTYEILNVRAQSKPSRDLLSDLEDIQNGISITHESDRMKRQKQEKKEKRAKNQEAKIKRLEKKILTVGYNALEEYSLDKIHADKWLSPERIEELEEMRRDSQKEDAATQITFNISSA